MTLRLCFLGNSHIACIRRAWTTEPETWPGIAPLFVGAHRNLLLDTAEVGGRLVPTSDGAARAFSDLAGIRDVDLGAFDAFVVTGCLVSLGCIANLYRDARWLDLPSIAAHDDLAAEPAVLMSDAAVQMTAEDILSRRLGLRVARHLRTMTDRPIVVTSQARVSAVIEQAHRPGVRAHHAALKAGDGASLSALFDSCAARACRDADATFLPQPRHTITRDILTARPYMDGAVRLTADGNTPQPPRDITHANARYGAAVLDQIATHFGV